MNAKPDFEKAYVTANEMLIKSSVIQSFPFSPKSLVDEQSMIVCRSYNKALKYGVNIRDFGSESAAIFRFGSKSIIFYDESKPKSHIAFSILHEFGHDRLGHDFGNKDVEVYAKYEVETNYFVAQLLMPEQITREVQRRGKNITSYLLQSAFGVSAQAAEKRIETLAKTRSEWRTNSEKEFDDIILHRYADFLNKICPIQNYYDFEYDYARQQNRYSWY